MPRRLVPLVLVLAVTGCTQLGVSRKIGMEDASRMATVPADTTGTAPSVSVHMVSAPGTEATAKRVGVVGQQLVASNPQAGIRPWFLTVGAGHVEAFHRGPE